MYLKEVIEEIQRQGKEEEWYFYSDTINRLTKENNYKNRYFFIRKNVDLNTYDLLVEVRATNKLGDTSHECYNFLMKRAIYNNDWHIIKYKKTILDKVEKKYLSSVIKPFRKDIAYIKKSISYKEYYLSFWKNELLMVFNLPNFSLNSNMYKGMEENRKYTLEELGI